MSGTATCPICGEEAKMTCKGCVSLDGTSNMSYCSRQCRETDWRSHSLLCREFGKFQERPSANMRRAIYLNVGGDGPEFLWIPVHDERDKDGDLLGQSVDFFPIMGEAEPTSRPITTNRLTGAILERPLLFHCCQSSILPVNRSVMRTRDSKDNFEWHGPLLATCGDENGVQDMDLRDYAGLIAFFLTYASVQPGISWFGPKIQAVHVLCNGDCEDDPTRRYQAVSLPRLHPVLHKSERSLSTLSMLIDMPLVVIRFPYLAADDESIQLDYAQEGETDDFDPHDKGLENRALADLLTDCDYDGAFDLDAENPGFGFSPKTFAYRPGSAIVFRSDLEPLDPKALHAFVCYCEIAGEGFRSLPQFQGMLAETARGERPGPGGRGWLAAQRAVANVNPQAWTAFWEGWSRLESCRDKMLEHLAAGPLWRFPTR